MIFYSLLSIIFDPFNVLKMIFNAVWTYKLLFFFAIEPYLFIGMQSTIRYESRFCKSKSLINLFKFFLKNLGGLIIYYFEKFEINVLLFFTNRAKNTLQTLIRGFVGCKIHNATVADWMITPRKSKWWILFKTHLRIAIFALIRHFINR